MKPWCAGNTRSAGVSVNLSAKQFRDQSLIAHVDTLLQQTELPAACLKLEITESLLMESAEHVTDTLLQLRDMGVAVYLDEFGTGYSSLNYLHRFPIQAVKIDRSFVERMEHNPKNIEIIRAIVQLTHNLDMNVIAEGLETYAQVELLRQLQCDRGQGYYFSKPLDPQMAQEFIEKLPT